MLYIEQNPLKANMVKAIEEYPYSSAHIFLGLAGVGECLSSAWITKKYQGDIDSIKAYLGSPADAMQLQKLKTASSLIEAPNMEKKPDVKKLQMMLAKRLRTATLVCIIWTDKELRKIVLY